jgi:hypothetical protein
MVRRLDALVFRLRYWDDVAANPTGLHPDPKAGEGVIPHNHVLIGGLDPLDNRLAQLFGDHLFSPGTLSCRGKR